MRIFLVDNSDTEEQINFIMHKAIATRMLEQYTSIIPSTSYGHEYRL